MKLLAAATLAAAAAAAAASALPDLREALRGSPITTDFDTGVLSSGQGFSYQNIDGYTPKSGRPYSGVAAALNGHQYFHMALPDGSPGSPGTCKHHQNVSVTAYEYNCIYATNGGFFSFVPQGCVGNYVVNGTAVQLPDSGPATNFAVLRNGSFLVGYVSPAQLPGVAAQATQLVSGLGWLVRDGASYVEHSQDLDPTSKFATEYAPRTAVTVSAEGAIGLVVVNGIELAGQGVSLVEFANILLGLGARQAVNLDGGGSSDAVYKDRVVSKPTCTDSPLICERPVASITCVSSGAGF